MGIFAIIFSLIAISLTYHLSNGSYSYTALSCLVCFAFFFFIDSVPKKIKNTLSKYPPLQRVYSEIKSGLTFKVLNSVFEANIPQEELETFWLFLARQYSGDIRTDAATTAAISFRRCGVGFKAVEYFFSLEEISTSDKIMVASELMNLLRRIDIIKVHHLLTDKVKIDSLYNSFLQRHIQVLVDSCYKEVEDYLLIPDRGPGNYNVDNIFIVARHAADNEKLVDRWCDWISNGQFSDLEADVLYQILNEIIDNQVVQLFRVVECTMQNQELFRKFSSDEYSNNKNIFLRYKHSQKWTSS